MRCGSCGADLPTDARFCSRCGAGVELGSVLGVGTDLPPVPVAQPPAGRQGREEADDAGGADGGDQRSRGGFSIGELTAMVATFVVLSIIGTFTLTQVFGPDTADPSTPTAGPSEGPGEPTTSPTTPSASPSPAATLPATARRCSRSGADGVATAWSGNRDTSCAFSDAVRTAYREAGAPVHPTSFRTWSPVTKRWYDVTCGEGALVRCASADGAAVVFLGP